MIVSTTLSYAAGGEPKRNVHGPAPALGATRTSEATGVDQPPAAARSDQDAAVAAVVNGEQITTDDIDQVMTSIDSKTVPRPANSSRKQVLERLIDQRLLTQQAILQGLDQDPRMVAAAKAQGLAVLARGYLEAIMTKATYPRRDDVHRFYLDHPELFSQRRVYRFQEMAIAAGEDLYSDLRDELKELDKLTDKQKVMPELAQWLETRNIKFKRNNATQAAEQLPMELVPRVHQMKDGDILLIPRGSAFVVSVLESSEAAPLDEQRAEPYIEQYLVNRARLQLAEDELKRLRAAATIEYVGPVISVDGAR
jgi:EpsD family peptidyl-prolyl cis-trans isomerase